MTNSPEIGSRVTAVLLSFSMILAGAPAPRAWGQVYSLKARGPMQLSLVNAAAIGSVGSQDLGAYSRASLNLNAAVPNQWPMAAEVGLPSAYTAYTAGTLQGAVSKIAAAAENKADDSGAETVAKHLFDGEKPSGDGQGPSSGGQGPVGGGGGDAGKDSAYPTDNLPILPAPKVSFPHTQEGFSLVLPKNSPYEDVIKSANNGYILLATSKNTKTGVDDFFPSATLTKVIKVEEQGKTIKVQVRFVREAKITDHAAAPHTGLATASVSYPAVTVGDAVKVSASLNTALALLKPYIPAGSPVNRAVSSAIQEQRIDKVSFLLASLLPDGKEEIKQEILAATSIENRLDLIVRAMTEVSVKADGTIGQEGDEENELDALKKRIDGSDLTPAAKKAALDEFKKVKRAGEKGGADTEVSRNYIDWLLSLPWTKRTDDRFDLAKAREILDRDHSGVEMVKNRILEYLAVRKRTNSIKGPILCFVGPPGVGKTSIAKAIAEAVGRKFVRIALGGVSDPAEIRGHRRTYVGAIPGTVLQKMKEAGTVNPVMLLDEIEKLGRGQEGDPSAALLELLDPAQNDTFRDNYLGVAYDMSQVLFVTTANDLNAIPEPLRNRMEVIEFSSYINEEKIGITQKHLPNILKEHGLTGKEVSFTDGALLKIISDYTMEAGVRTVLQRVGTVLRKIVSAMEMTGSSAPGQITDKDITSYLGDPKYAANQPDPNGVGVATGLAVSGYGGTAFNVEVLANDGHGEIVVLNKMKGMMQDSAKITMEYLESISMVVGMEKGVLATKKITINIPSSENNDGPSGGITMATAIASRLSGRAVKQGVAMTGEITLYGKVKPIGGLREKILGAHRIGMRTVIYPAANQQDINGIPESVMKDMRLVPVETFEQVINEALESKQD